MASPKAQFETTQGEIFLKEQPSILLSPIVPKTKPAKEESDNEAESEEKSKASEFASDFESDKVEDKYIECKYLFLVQDRGSCRGRSRRGGGRRRGRGRVEWKKSI